MHENLRLLQDAIEQLKSQREHVGNSTCVLEAIIAHCSEIASQAQRFALCAAATGIRTEAISLYATPKTNTSTTISFLEDVIARLEKELNLERELVKARGPSNRWARW